MNHLLLGLSEQEHVHINPFPRVYQEGQPACSYTRLISGGGNQQIGVIHAIDCQIMGVPEIDRGRGEKLRGGDAVCAVSKQMSGNHLTAAGEQRRLGAGFPVEQLVQDFDSRFIFRFRLRNFVPALQQIGFCCLFCRHQGRKSIFLCIVTAEAFILKDQEKAPGDGFLGSDAPNQLLIVLLQLPAFFIRFVLEFPADEFQMPVDVRFFCQHFHLDFYRADFQIMDIRV